LKQAVTTLAHHINNHLVIFSFELDSLEAESQVDQKIMSAFITPGRRCIRKVSSVIKILDQLEKIHTVPYVGAVEMIDIEEALTEQL